jgi:hypothetical protein
MRTTRLFPALALAASAASFADEPPSPVPMIMQHHGRLLGPNDQPLNGPVTIRFSLYADREKDPFNPATTTPL